MEELYEQLKHYNLQDFINYEKKDRQFLSLKKLYKNINDKNKKYYLKFIIANSLVCYQLSGLGEKYWEEFGKSLEKYLNNGKTNIYKFFEKFLPNSKSNKRLLEIKLKRIKKIEEFLENFEEKEKYYYEDMLQLRDDLAKTMNQKKQAKTIIFSVKMFSYGARLKFKKLIYFPKNLNISFDSRIIKIYEKYGKSGEKIEDFYNKLADKLEIPELHLDAILRTEQDLIK